MNCYTAIPIIQIDKYNNNSQYSCPWGCIVAKYSQSGLIDIFKHLVANHDHLVDSKRDKIGQKDKPQQILAIVDATECLYQQHKSSIFKYKISFLRDYLENMEKTNRTSRISKIE